MSVVIVEDAAWKAILADERLAGVRRKLSFHEIRLIVQHARSNTRPTPDLGEDDETYEIGKRDGYEKAVQEIDELTGGDGEYVASTFPERDCRDSEAMKRRIVERFESLHAELERGEKE